MTAATAASCSSSAPARSRTRRTGSSRPVKADTASAAARAQLKHDIVVQIPECVGDRPARDAAGRPKGVRRGHGGHQRRRHAGDRDGRLDSGRRRGGDEIPARLRSRDFQDAGRQLAGDRGDADGRIRTAGDAGRRRRLVRRAGARVGRQPLCARHSVAARRCTRMSSARSRPRCSSWSSAWSRAPTFCGGSRLRRSGPNS